MRHFDNPRLLVELLLCAAAIASAQQTAVPRLIRFSGSFHAPINQPPGPVGATFAIYNEQERGVPLWTEDQNIELDASGNYTVLLGSTKNSGVPVELFAGAEARWLQVNLYLPGEVDLPRVLLVSVPYALKAGDAETLGGKPPSAYVLSAPSPSASREQPTESARAKIWAASALPSASSGSPNYIAKFTNTTDVVNSVMYQNGSNIGVGTTQGAISMDIRPTATSPFAQLGVAQTTDYMTLFASDTYGPAFYWDPNKALRFGIGGTGLYNASGFKEYMRIQPNGNMGIGTQNPATKLEVNGNAQVDGNLTLSGSILSPSNMVPLIQAPADGSNFSAGLAALPGLHGGANTSIGNNTLYSNQTGSQNTVVGYAAMQANTTGDGNTAAGYQSLWSNTSGYQNTAFGISTMVHNTIGGGNTAIGAIALGSNTTGNGNTASGDGALLSNSTGGINTAVGESALSSNISGGNNIGIGYMGGYNITSSSNNIDIGNEGTAGDSGVIRIGTTNTQTSAFIAGIRGVTTSNNNAVPVLVDSYGQLGTISSSRRYKEDIQDMGEASSGVMRLRPVTFRYKKPYGDGSKPVQYGLIAEEVAEVYPDLVVRGTDGQVETVKYQLLDPLLLNELQKQHATIEALEQRVARLEAALLQQTAAASTR